MTVVCIIKKIKRYNAFFAVLPLDEDRLFPGPGCAASAETKRSFRRDRLSGWSASAWNRGSMRMPRGKKDGYVPGMRVYDQQRNWQSGKTRSPERCEWLADIGMFRGRSRS